MTIIQASGGEPPQPPFGNPTTYGGERSEPRRRRALVVDDERLIADTVAQILNIHGYDAFAAYGPADALTLASSFHPDFLLSDVVMPGMNGIELASKIKSLQPNVKILLFSGQAGTSQLLQQSAMTFKLEAKPIHPEKLLEVLAKLERDN